jgi:hypothetical protein
MRIDWKEYGLSFLVLALTGKCWMGIRVRIAMASQHPRVSYGHE